MKKEELASALAIATGQTKKSMFEVLTALPGILAIDIAENGRSELPGIAIFQVVDRAARPGRNPTTGEVINIPARKAIKAKANKLEKLSGI